MGDPHILAYTGLGVLGLIACLLAGLTWPLALWRSSSERFADFLLLDSHAPGDAQIGAH